MNGPDAPGEFETIARLLRPLAQAHPAALDLLDDAAVLPGRPGFDLVISQDAMTAGVHFLASMPMDKVARRLLRAALSDLAAKAAEPFGYFLTLAWPGNSDWAQREAFAAGLKVDGDLFEVALLGGDTISTCGPFTASVTVLGWAPAGRMVRRSGARAGDLLLVSGTIGDGILGLKVALGEVEPDPHLLERFEQPRPRFDLRDAVQASASASADVSDGLLADTLNIATASALAVVIDLETLPLSASAAAWLQAQENRTEGLITLATGGDDYELVLASPRPIAGMTVIGRFDAGQGLQVRLGGALVGLDRLGYRHGG